MNENDTKVRYAVIGLGYFAQAAVLPAFKKAKNAELVALVSDDAQKLDELGKKYEVPDTLGYGALDDYLLTGKVDAVYIALPNSLHCEYTLRAAAAGVNVLCEKPMAVTPADCERMILACRDARVKLMVAYRLHFEAANLEAIEIIRSGKLGDVRAFNSVFTMQVKEDNIRVRSELGGGPLYDIGIYCINAARYCFRAEPLDVMAMTGARSDDKRFEEVEEQVGAILRFPGDRIATVFASFGAADNGRYEVVGTKGTLRVDPAYEFSEALKHELVIEGKKSTRSFDKRDQVAPELIYFSDCVIHDRQPEPSGVEGLADVRIIQAIHESARSGVRVAVESVTRRARPTAEQEIHTAAHGMPKLVNADPPSH